jgi:hypothetical protein
LALDGAAWLIRDELNHGGMLRHHSAGVTLEFWPEWTQAVACAEHKGEIVLFSVGEFGRSKVWAGYGLAKHLAEFISELPQEHVPRRLLCVNVADILAAMLQNGRKLGFNMGLGSFCLPPDHPKLVGLVQEAKRRRNAREREFDLARVTDRRLTPTPELRKLILEASCALN